MQVLSEFNLNDIFYYENLSIKKLIVLSNPSLKLILGSQSKYSFANEIFGFLLLGSSEGKGWWIIYRIYIYFWAIIRVQFNKI